MVAAFDRSQLLIIAAATLVRLAVVAYAWEDPDRFLLKPDSLEYVTIARNLADGHGFSQASAPPYVPDLRRTPLYPALLSLSWSVPIVSRAPIVAGVLLNAIAGIGVVALLCRFGGDMLGRTAASVAAGLMAANPSSIAYDVSIVTEPLFTILITAAVLVMSRQHGATLLCAIGSGVLLGAATLVRPIGLFLAPALLPAFLVPAGWPPEGARHGPHRVVRLRWRIARALGLYLAMNAAFVLTLTPWIARNARTFGTTELTSVGAVNMYFHRAAAVEARLEGTDVDTVRARWQRQFDELSRHWPAARQTAWLQARAREIIRQHPVVYVRATIAGLLRMLGPDRDRLPVLLGLGQGSTWRGVLVLTEWTFLLTVYAAAAIGALALVRAAPSRPQALTLLTLLAYFVITAGPEVYARFRVPLMVPLTLLAGAGLAGWRGHSWSVATRATPPA